MFFFGGFFLDFWFCRVIIFDWDYGVFLRDLFVIFEILFKDVLLFEFCWVFWLVFMLNFICFKFLLKLFNFMVFFIEEIFLISLDIWECFYLFSSFFFFSFNFLCNCCNWVLFFGFVFMFCVGCLLVWWNGNDVCCMVFLMFLEYELLLNFFGMVWWLIFIFDLVL